jgi:hypothetical protein
MDINNGNNIRRTESEGTEEELGSLNLNAKHFNHTTEYM